VVLARKPSTWLMALVAPSSTPMSITFCRSSAESKVLVNTARVPPSVSVKV